MQLNKTPDLNASVHLNVVFIGERMKSSHEEYLHHWFEHLDHSIKASIAQYYDFGETEENKLSTLTHIYYEAISLSPSVEKCLEKYMNHFIRPDISIKRNDNHYEPDRYVMPSLIMEDLLSNLINTLSKSHPLINSYTLFILDINRPIIPVNSIYGYRNGFTRPELITILSELRDPTSTLFNPLLVKEIEYDVSNNNKEYTATTSLPAEIINKSKDKGEKPTLSITWNELNKESEIWSNKMMKSLNSTGPQQLINRVYKLLNRIVEGELVKSNEIERDELLQDLRHISYEIDSDIIQNGIHTDCLVDLWVSSSRFGWIDLNAGPFSWGDIVISDGVKIHDSVPRLNTSKLSLLSKVAFSDKLVSNYVDGLNKREKELNIKENSVCKSGLDSVECIEVRKEIENLKNNKKYNDILLNQVKISTDISQIKDKNYNIDLISKLTKEEIEFYSKLSNVVNTFTHQVLIPPYSPSYLKRPITIPKRIIYKISIIKYQKDYDILNLIDGGLDIDMLKRHLKEFHLPNQEVSISSQEMFIDKDPELGVAIEDSIKTVLFQKLNSKGQYHPINQRYIDSKTLSNILSSKTYNSLNGNSNTQIIPIYILSVSEDLPLLIDEHHVAVVLENSVLAVQNKQLYFKSHFECNKRTIYWSLRNPISHILRATSSLAGSLVPLSFKYDDIYNCTAKQWIWSVGDSPLSYLSSHPKFSLINIDNSYRSMIYRSLEQSKEFIEKSDELLKFINLNNVPAHVMANHTVDFERMESLRNSVLKAWKHILVHTEMLDFIQATEHVNPMMKDIQEYLSISTRLYDELHTHNCKFEQLGYTSFSVSAVLCVIIIMIFFSLRRYFKRYFMKSKPKIC